MSELSDAHHETRHMLEETPAQLAKSRFGSLGWWLAMCLIDLGTSEFRRSGWLRERSSEVGKLIRRR